MLADVVRERWNEVLEVARQRLAELTPPQDIRAADAHLPLLLAAIGADLGDPRANPDTDSRIASSAADYGREQQRLGFEIELVVRDFGAICDAISEIAGRTGVQIGATDWQRLNRALDSGIAHALSGYEALRREKERRTSAAELGSIAHELRNALAAASLAFESVKRGRVGTQSRTAEIVTRNLTHSALLASTLVLQSKERGQPELTLASLALRPIVDDIVATAPPTGDVTIQVDVAPDLVLLADRELLSSALTNLVQNALKFTRPKGTAVIRARATDEGTTIEVEDECGGLPPEKAAALFKPFVQQATDRTGAGLGLSIVRSIMLGHGGSARVRDLPGRGCVFELAFPRRGPQ